MRPYAAACVAAAMVAALAPFPAWAVERWYSRGVYPRLQRLLTSASNLAPFSIFDVLLALALVLVVLATYRAIRARGWRVGVVVSTWRIVVAAAAIYLVFLATWGLNYRRVPLIDQVAFDTAHVNASGAEALARRAVAELNASHDEAHGHPPTMADLAVAFDAVRTALQPSPPMVHGRAKQTLLGGYFHEAGISGMTDPFLLETLVAPDLLEVERPFVVAHEWAHLAGYADESEANFVAWLTCTRGGAGARYSGWLALLGYLPDSRHALRDLSGGPRADLFALRYRYQQTSRAVRAAAAASYDKYLKANRVRAGVDSYDLVVQLVLGTAYDPRGNPVLR